MILQPPSTLLIGPSGSGKTSALATQLLFGLEVFVIMTEPGGVDSLIDSCERLKAPIDRLHWTSCLPAAAGWGDLEDMVKKINTMDQKGLADLRDMGKASFRPAAMKLLEATKGFSMRTNWRMFWRLLYLGAGALPQHRLPDGLVSHWVGRDGRIQADGESRRVGHRTETLF